MKRTTATAAGSRPLPLCQTGKFLFYMSRVLIRLYMVLFLDLSRVAPETDLER